MTREFYLQGSYRSDTNIVGNSDVDVALELKSSTYYDTSSLSYYEQGLVDASYGPASYDWNDFRRETLKALEAGFGREVVSQGNKSIKLRSDPPMLAADVVVCAEHRRYTSRFSYVEGITLLALQDRRWIVNYPKEHYKDGAAKSSRTWDRFKRTVRMFKNARNHLESTGRIRADLAPSYFVECLLYPESTEESWHLHLAASFTCAPAEITRLFGGFGLTQHPYVVVVHRNVDKVIERIPHPATCVSLIQFLTS